MNRILRPNGYFILSSNNEKIEDDEGIYTVYLKLIIICGFRHAGLGYSVFG